MIVISTLEDVAKINDKTIIPYINNFVSDILKAYYPNRSLETVGAIYFLENKNDLNKYEEMGLTFPIFVERFELIENIGNGYINGCIVLNNDFAINIIGKTEYFDWSDNHENN